ncbi:MAG: C40 family peptidase [Kiritimatiellae bacterium]|nr:C40 family peptidase [Kiritimatiellia bacterium]
MDFLHYLDNEVDRAIYVRGAQGENVLAKSDPEGWIRDMETIRRSGYASHKEEYDKNAERAIALFRKRKAAGINPIRAYDCSGLIVHYALDIAEIIKKDYTAAGIYKALCTVKLNDPATIRGQLVFKTSEGPNEITHVGVYVGNGQLIECRGRDYGVIQRAYNPDEWQLAGEWPDLMRCCADPQPISALMNGDIMRAIQSALNAAGYVDGDNHPLEVDGKYGKLTAAALEQLVRYNMPDLKLTITRSGSVWAYAEK